MPNGTIKLASKAIDFAKEKPIWAAFYFLVLITVYPGVVSVGTSFWSQDSAVTSALAELRKDNEDLKQGAVSLASEIKAERETRILEMVRLKEEGKLLSEDSIKLTIRDELDRFEERLVKMLKSRN